MTPYHYSVVKCCDSRGELRNVGLLVVSSFERRAWLRRGPPHTDAHLHGEEAAFVRAVLDAIEHAAGEVARGGDPARVHEWMRLRSRPTEDAISLSAPRVGVAADLEEEANRLADVYVGSSGAGGPTTA